MRSDVISYHDSSKARDYDKRREENNIHFAVGSEKPGGEEEAVAGERKENSGLQKNYDKNTDISVGQYFTDIQKFQHYIISAGDEGIEPPTSVLETEVIPLN